MQHTFRTLDQEPDLVDQIHRLNQTAWPEFLHHGNIRQWHILFEMFPAFQIVLCDPAQKVIAVGHTVPLVWDGTVVDLPADINTILTRAKQAVKTQQSPTTLSALAVIVAEEYRGKGHSTRMVQAMRALAGDHGLTALIAPVRPTLKATYPLASFERYLEWTREDRAPFDPWLRVHWRLGAEKVRIIPQGVVVRGTVSEWESWTGLRFPESGPYIVSGALQPIEINCEKDQGYYADPNVWMRHPV